MSYQETTGSLLASGYDKLGTQEAVNDMYVTSFWDGSQTAATLTANNAGGGQRMPDKENFNCVLSLENHPNDARMKVDSAGKGLNLSGRMGTGGNNTPMCMETYRKEAHPQTADEGQGWTTTTTTDTLNSFDNTENRTPTLAASEYAVRRLTPEECEILQGYPVGWTDIGEWVDSKGKARQTTDSARYKALGNSICLPPWKWVLKRIAAQYERDATMGSLFDGIGGFPYLWEQINYKGSCLWASEIEEFCVAVTERRINGNEMR